MAKTSPLALAKQLLGILDNDLVRLERIDRYRNGMQDDPYMPKSADAEYKLLAKRAVTNICQFITFTPAQAMYVDSFRRASVGTKKDTTDELTPEMKHWQRSGLDARQTAVYTGALGFGHSFVLTEKTKSGTKSKGLSALRTSALYADPANDIDPYAALTVVTFPKGDAPGKARMFDKTSEYEVSFKNLSDQKNGVSVKRIKAHGAKENPITRFAAVIDLEGRTMGVIEPAIPLQDRLNQTVFDLLVVQSFASFKVRTVSGMAPPMKMKAVIEDGEVVDWEPEVDDQGRPIPEDINLNAKRFFFAEDTDTKFDTMDETPLDGFIKAIELAFRHMAALTNTPPHDILGEIANLSAEALQAAETSLSRKVQMFKTSFGESWERVFRIAAQMEGVDTEEDFTGEVIWRDMEQKSLSQTADALGKLHDQVGAPMRGLWEEIPGMTSGKLTKWNEYKDAEDSARDLADSIYRAGSTGRPTVSTGAPEAA